MFVYYRGTSSDHRLFIQPAIDFPHVNAWREPDGRPKMFDIHFVNGEADVEENIGQYLVDKGLAAKTKVIASMSEVV